MIYFAEAVGIGHIKIGFTDGEDPACRLDQLQTGSPVPLRLLGTIAGTLEDEKNLHRRFAAARVCGEWFKPIPELLALLSVEQLSCGKTAVAEKSVSIRVLTVGRKQFTKALLDQLPEKPLVPWFEIAEDIQQRKLSYCDLTRDIRGDVWGWIQAPDFFECDDAAGDGKYYKSRWIIFVHKDRMYKDRDFIYSNGFQSQSLGHSVHSNIVSMIMLARDKTPGFRDEDQLYIGI